MMIQRREFITLLGGAAAAWPLAARAQQSGKLRTIGLLSAGSMATGVFAGFDDGLRELGWTDGKNVIIERRFAENRIERLPDLAAELVRLNVDVIVGFGTPPPLAAKRATTTIPIVMVAAGDPVGSGLVASLARPGGNVTGTSLMAPDLGGKRLVGLEACATAHYWTRELRALGHEVRLMPAQYVKAYIKRNKHDAADAEAIC